VIQVPIIRAVATLLAWLGGAAFAVSLGYLVYFYAVVLGEPAGATGREAARAATVDALLFAAFVLHHSLFARAAVKAWLVRRVPASLERTIYVWIASVLLLMVCLAWQPIGGMVYAPEGLVRWLLHAVQVCGGVLTAVATRTIDGLALAGIPQATSGGAPRHDAISRAGPFGLVRHPIYLGWLLMVGAAPAMTANRLLFAALSIGYLILAIPWEERSLVAAHGDRYRAYRQTVRWRLVPGVW
jgi:protein-S-isoprenylcysteine O-methyltransferase Ste14